MKQFISLLLLITIYGNFFGQDIDFYHKQNNDLFKMPSINKQMSFKEYQILSQSFRMQDMMYASLVPGYVHFKAQDYATAYGILAVRTSAAVVIFYEQNWISKNIADTSFWATLFNNKNTNVPENHAKILTTATLVFVSSYLFDIIHGKYRLEKKQEAIRYKYSMKASLIGMTLPNNQTAYGFGLKIKF